MGERAHLSIGEVLSLVQEEFPDITISKIRFLESQGLLDPERTPSGYRKFYPADIDRLQWILLQQRDHFLPLKVIRQRLAEWDATGTRPSGSNQTPAAEDLPGAEQGGAEQGSGQQDTAVPETEPPEEAASAVPASVPGQDGDPVEEAVDSGGDEPGEAEEMSATRYAASSLAASSAMEVATPAREPAAPSEEPVDTQTEPDVTAAGTSPAGGLQVGPQDSALTAEELADQAGVDVRVVHELEGFSMIESRRVGPETYYDPEYLDIVRACRAFLDHGVEVRHLRMYKIAAEREAGVLEQLIMPLLKQRNPDARARAVDTVRELSQVGEELHAALLRHALQHTLP